MPSPEAITEYWRHAHAANDVKRLSGNGENTLDILMVRPVFETARTMLNIGVGLGTLEHFCAGEVKVIDSLDVAPEARYKVEAAARNFFLEPGELPSSEYDLITECLVALHLTAEQMEEHIRNAVRALKPDGLYAFNAPDYICYDEATVRQQSHEEPTVAQMNSGYSLCRSIPWYEMTARKSGALLALVAFSGIYRQYNAIHYVYHLRRA